MESDGATATISSISWPAPAPERLSCDDMFAVKSVFNVQLVAVNALGESLWDSGKCKTSTKVILPCDNNHAWAEIQTDPQGIQRVDLFSGRPWNSRLYCQLRPSLRRPDSCSVTSLCGSRLAAPLIDKAFEDENHSDP